MKNKILRKIRQKTRFLVFRHNRHICFAFSEPNLKMRLKIPKTFRKILPRSLDFYVSISSSLFNVSKVKTDSTATQRPQQTN